MKKVLFLSLTLLATTFMACNPKHENVNPPQKTDTIVVSQDLQYVVYCNEAALQIMDFTLDYLTYPGEDIKTIAITQDWKSDLFSALSGRFGIRFTVEPKKDFVITDNLFDATNGAYISINYQIRDVFKQGSVSEFESKEFCHIDLRGKKEFKDKLTADAIRIFSHSCAYDYLYDPETNSISLMPIKDYWEGK